MTTKLQNYIQLAGQTAAQVTKTPRSWVYFLNTASRLYRYPFPDQLMIYAQRPKATACAGYELWNKRMSRYVRRGSKGIGLVTVHNGYPKLHYVFDVADTGKKTDTSSLFLWQYKEDYRGIVMKALEEQFSVSGEKGLVYQLEMIAIKLTNKYWKNYHKDIMQECEGSLMGGLEEQEASVKFRLAAAASISYALLARCGFKPMEYIKDTDFRDIPDFNTQRIIKVLGAAVSESSEQVLRTIAVTIYHHEYRKQTASDTSRPVQPYSDSGQRQPVKAPVQEDNTKAPEPVTVDTVQDDAKAPEPVAAVTTDTEESVPADTEAVPDIPDVPEAPAPIPCNFIITDDRLGGGGPKTKFRRNIQAIRTLKQIESENRAATSDEQEILSKYVGWGGIPDAFEPDKAGWEKESLSCTA